MITQCYLGNPEDSPSILRATFLTVLKLIYGSINDDPIWLVVLPVYALWGCRRACGSWVFSEDMELEHWPEMGRAQEKKYISAIKMKIQVRKKSVASTEKDEKVLYFVFFSLC